MHTASYRGIINGQGYGLEEARNAVDIVFYHPESKTGKNIPWQNKGLEWNDCSFCYKHSFGKID